MNDASISLIILVPFLGTLFQFLFALRKEPPRFFMNWVAILSSIFSSIFTVYLIFASDDPIQGTRFVTPWINGFSIQFDILIDGLNSLQLLFGALVFPVLLLSELNSGKVGDSTPNTPRLALLLLLQSVYMGASCANDLFLLFFFWGASAIPLYFLLVIYGRGDREKAAYRYIMPATLGNILVFLALIIIYYAAEPHTLSISDLSGGKLDQFQLSLFGNNVSVGTVGFFLFLFGIGIRVALFPFHGWFTYVCSQANPITVMALAGVSFPLGLSILFKVNYLLFPAQVTQYGNLFLALGSVTSILAALWATAQKEKLRLIAFIALVIQGIFFIGFGSVSEAGVLGSLFLTFGGNIALVIIGLLTGIFLNQFGHTRILFKDVAVEKLKNPSGLAGNFLTMIGGIATASLIGLPGTATFIGLALSAMGGYSASPSVLFALVISEIILTYCLVSQFQGIYGQEKVETIDWVSAQQKSYLAFLALVVVLFGVYPRPILELVGPRLAPIIAAVRSAEAH